MRVLFWSGTFWPNVGGVEVLATKLLVALREHGYEFRVVTPLRDPALPMTDHYEGIPVHRLPFAVDANNIDQVMRLRQRITKLKREFAPHLIHINAVSMSDFFHLTTASAHPAPLLVTLHGQWEDQLDSVVGHTLRNATWVVGSSVAILQRGQKLTPGVATRSSIIPNAVETPTVLPQPLPRHEPRVLCLGRLVWYKGFDLAIYAFALVTKRFPQARLIIAGDGPMRTDLERQAAELDLTHAVEFIGQVAPENVLHLINSVNMLVLPSWGEGLPVVALEAALMARPLVATRVGGLPEIVEHGKTGWLIERNDGEGLAEAISFLLGHYESATQMGCAARRQVQKTFSFERCVTAYDTLYQQLTSSLRQ